MKLRIIVAEVQDGDDREKLFREKAINTIESQTGSLHGFQWEHVTTEHISQFLQAFEILTSGYTKDLMNKE